MEQMKIIHEAKEQDGRFVAYYEGVEAGFIKYQFMEDGNINANGTLVYDAFRDKKLGSPLLEALMDFARTQNIKIYPTCPYVVKMMKRDINLHRLLTDAFKADNGIG